MGDQNLYDTYPNEVLASGPNQWSLSMKKDHFPAAAEYLTPNSHLRVSKSSNLLKQNNFIDISQADQFRDSSPVNHN